MSQGASGPPHSSLLTLASALLVTACALDPDPGSSATEPSSSSGDVGNANSSTSSEPEAGSMPGTLNTSSDTTTSDTTTSDTRTSGTTSSPASSTGATAPSTGAPGLCGDGILDDDEECDLGSENSDHGLCTTLCEDSVCGDGFVQEGNGEECDQGLANNDNSLCTAMCLKATCGDGLLYEGAEECDDGDANDAEQYNGCAPETCTRGPHCGDGETQKPHEDCDLGETQNGQGDSACTKLCKLGGKAVFASSKLYDGALGGLAGADEKCNSLASAAELTSMGSFMAWLSTDDDSTASRMTPYSGLYVLVDGETVIAESWPDLIDNTLKNPIMLDELGAEILQERAWTGSTASGQTATPTCDGWTTASKKKPGRQGLLSAVDSGWSTTTAVHCSFQSHLICIEQ